LASSTRTCRTRRFTRGRSWSATDCRRSRRRRPGCALQSGQRSFCLLEVPPSSADTAVARVVQLLKDRRQYDAATIVFTAIRGGQDSGARARRRDPPRAAHRQAAGPRGRRAARRLGCAAHRSAADAAGPRTSPEFRGGCVADRCGRFSTARTGAVGIRRSTPSRSKAAFRVRRRAGIRDHDDGGARFQRGPGEALAPVDGCHSTDVGPSADALRGSWIGFSKARRFQPPRPSPPRTRDAYAAGWLPPRLEHSAATAHAGRRGHAGCVVWMPTVRRCVLVAARQLPAAIAALHSITRTRPDLATVHVQIASLLARTGSSPRRWTRSDRGDAQAG
jgi:hypothetical protein